MFGLPDRLQQLDYISPRDTIDVLGTNGTKCVQLQRSEPLVALDRRPIATESRVASPRHLLEGMPLVAGAALPRVLTALHHEPHLRSPIACLGQRHVAHRPEANDSALPSDGAAPEPVAPAARPHIQV
nr:hypothetical protein [Tritonibacter mobilis]